MQPKKISPGAVEFFYTEEEKKKLGSKKAKKELLITLSNAILDLPIEQYYKQKIERLLKTLK